MAQVNLTIGGLNYRMACEDGQEAHLTALGHRLDRAIAQLRQRFGDIGEQRLTLMAAMTMADQQDATERRFSAREAELAAAIDALAERLEGMADRAAGAPAKGQVSG